MRRAWPDQEWGGGAEGEGGPSRERQEGWEKERKPGPGEDTR